jgi:hypothetical protein
MICGNCCAWLKDTHPSAAIFDSGTLQSSPESGGRAGYEGAKRRKGSKRHMAVDRLGNLLALHLTAANEQDRDQVSELAQRVQEVRQPSVEVAFVDPGAIPATRPSQRRLNREYT